MSDQAKHRRIRSNLTGYLFLSPWLLGLLAFTVIPIIVSLYFSFTNYDILTTPRWIGLKNYVNLFVDPRVQNSLKVTFKFVFIGVPLQLLFALLVALVLKQNRRGVKLYRAVYYLPSLFGSSVAVAVLWKQLFSRDGLLNKFLAVFGIKGLNWINTPTTALNTLIVLAVWQFGSSMVIFLAALKQISPDYYEASRIDGAGVFRQFFSITLPLLTPIVFFNVVMTVIGAFQSFTPAFIVSGGTGGPIDSTMFYTLYIYIKGFGEFHMGYACALAWILLLIIAAITALLFYTAKKWVYYD